jgi:hypothetical protein
MIHSTRKQLSVRMAPSPGGGDAAPLPLRRACTRMNSVMIWHVLLCVSPLPTIVFSPRNDGAYGGVAVQADGHVPDAPRTGSRSTAGEREIFRCAANPGVQRPLALFLLQIMVLCAPMQMV